MGTQFSNVFTQADPGQYVAVKSRHATSITGRTFVPLLALLSAHSDRDYQAQPAEAQASWLLGVVLKSSPGYARSGSSCPGEDLHGTLADLTFAKLA